MPTNDSDPSPGTVPPDVSPAGAASPEALLAVGPTAGRQSPPARIWTLTLAAGLIAGFASWLVGETLQGRFQPGLLVTNGIPSPEESKAHSMVMAAAVMLEATLAFASLGAALGLALGVAGGTAGRSARAASIAGVSGAILGAVAGAAMTQLLLPIYFRSYDPDNEDLILGLLIKGGISSAIGAAGGAALAFGIGLGDRGRAVRAILGGLLGAIAGVLVYELIGILAFPLDETTKPISATWGTRLLARLAVTIFASVGATLGANSAPRDGAGRHERRPDPQGRGNPS